MPSSTPQRVVISLGNGSLADGFTSVRVQRVDTPDQGNAQGYWQVTTSLPPIPELLKKYNDWSMMHQGWHMRSSAARANRGISVEPSGLTNVSKTTFDRVCGQIKSDIDRWFDSESFRPAKERLFSSLNKYDEIHLILETDDAMLWRIPWHQWGFFDLYPKAELILSPLESSSQALAVRSKSADVKMLAILGDSEGIDLEPDRQAIDSIEGLNTDFLVQPNRQTLSDKLRREQYDILFFAGHSTSQAADNTSKIYLSPTSGLSLSELSNGLERAIENGLQLAVFNSCDGVGLAQSLAKKLPHIIVMREDVPDRVAQVFLQHLLEAFACGRSLPLAMREARQALQGLEDDFPHASWLPLLCEHTQTKPLYWADWQVSLDEKAPVAQAGSRKTSPVPLLGRVATAVVTGLIASSLTIGVRSLGWLESTELWAYDQMIARRFIPEKPDSRILVVGVTEKDLETYGLYRPEMDRSVLSDSTLETALKKLQALKPKVIGSDIIRDIPLGSTQSHSNLLKTLKSSSSPIISACVFPDLLQPKTSPGYLPPSGIMTEQQGFINLPPDADEVVRRYTLASSPPDTDEGQCNTDQSLSLRLALRYKGLTDAGLTDKEDISIGDSVVPILRESGLYQTRPNKESQRGYQVLINHRSGNDSPGSLISLSDLLESRVLPERVENKVVLIGYVADSAKDDFRTSVTSGKKMRLPGVMIHAQVTSQLLSFILDKRPLVRSLSGTWESFLISVSSVYGAVVVGLSYRKRWILGLLFGVGVLGCSLGFMAFAFWIPVASVILAFLTGFSGQSLYMRRKQMALLFRANRSVLVQYSQD
jgi:CHASE2 domain-containing sensor protein